jgi:ubiquinone/menaquinone biosynthesis C-methylase UbiE
MDRLLLQKKTYETLPPKLYFEALTKGNKLQRFWHDKKFWSVLRSIDINRTTRVIDIGCGPGVLLSRIFRHANATVGLDISKNQVRFTNNLLKNNQNIVGACQNLPIRDNSMDCAFMVEVLEHLPPDDAEKVLKSIFRVLKKSGVLILTTPNYRSLWPVIEFFWNKINPINYNEQHINKLNIKKLRLLLTIAGFKDIKMETIFIISPFISLISEKFANKVMTLEKKMFPLRGSLIIVTAEK